MLAVILGFIAFAAVVGHFFVGPVDPPPPVEVSIADKAASIRDATVVFFGLLCAIVLAAVIDKLDFDF